jgi:long-chain acyl-CoA synthetase
VGGRDPRDLTDAAVAGDGDALLARDAPKVSYAELRRAVSARTTELEHLGAAPGRLVAVADGDPSGALVTVLAAWRAGAAVLPFDARAPRAAVDRVLALARPVAVARGGAIEPGGADARMGDPRAALLLFTSGSTADPKGVVLGAEGIAANVDAILAYLPVREARIVGLASPLAYSYGLVGQALTTLTAGATLAVLPSMTFATEVASHLRAASVRGLSSVPTTLRAVARVVATEPLHLRFAASAGAALDGATASLVERAFGGAELFNQYGLTEASPRVTAVSSRDPAFARGSVGRPVAGMSVEARGAEGDLFVRGPSVMLGYLDDPDGTRGVLGDDGWLATGDVGTVDGDGDVFVTGRRDGVVKCGGERVGVEEVAAMLRRAPGVRDACVLAAPDPEAGAKLWAFLECADDDLAGVRDFLRSQLSAAKRPRQLVALGSLPRGPNGKIDFKELRRRMNDAK